MRQPLSWERPGGFPGRLLPSPLPSHSHCMAEQLPQAVEVTTENQPRKAATAGLQLLPPQMVHSQVQTARTQLQSHFYYTSVKLMLKFSCISISKYFNLKLRSAKPTSPTEEHFLRHSKVALLPQDIQPTDPPSAKSEDLHPGHYRSNTCI